MPPTNPHDPHPVQANSKLVRLRGFVPHDLPAMYALDQICFRNGIAYSLAEFDFLTRQPSNFSLVAETPGNSLAGFAVSERSRRQGIATGHIITIDVDPACRRRGVGRKLIEALEAELVCHRVRQCVLEVAIDDAGAQEFYHNLGYQATGRMRRYYLGRLDAMVMEKQLVETVMAT